MGKKIILNNISQVTTEHYLILNGEKAGGVVQVGHCNNSSQGQDVVETECCSCCSRGVLWFSSPTKTNISKIQFHLETVDEELLHGYLYLIVPFWYTLAAYQASLVEPRFVFWRDVGEPKYSWQDQTSLKCRRSVPKWYN